MVSNCAIAPKLFIVVCEHTNQSDARTLCLCHNQVELPDVCVAVHKRASGRVPLLLGQVVVRFLLIVQLLAQVSFFCFIQGCTST